MDAAGVLSPQLVIALNQRLEAFERETSNQVIVATFPKIPDGYALEDFTDEPPRSGGVGQRKDDNGVVLFVFPNIASHASRLAMGSRNPARHYRKTDYRERNAPRLSSGGFQCWNSTRRERDPPGDSWRIPWHWPNECRYRQDPEGSWLVFLLFILVLVMVLAANRSVARRGTSRPTGTPRGLDSAYRRRLDWRRTCEALAAAAALVAEAEALVVEWQAEDGSAAVRTQDFSANWTTPRLLPPLSRRKARRPVRYVFWSRSKMSALTTSLLVPRAGWRKSLG